MATKKTEKPAAGPAAAGIRVTALGASFWRAGLQFTREPRELSLAELTPEQLELIRDEGDGGQLVVEDITLDPGKAAD